MQKSITIYLSLLGINLIYAFTSIFTKLASEQAFLSMPYLLWICGAICVMGVYAVLWQQIIKRMELSVAYMFKGTSLIFVLLLSALIFGEAITPQNIVGAMFIIVGIVMYAKA